MAVCVIMAVVASAVMTCVPGAMQMQASEMASCADIAGMDDEQSGVSSAATTDCCTHHDPSLTVAKADLLKTPLQHVSPWLAPILIVPTTISIITFESH